MKGDVLFLLGAVFAPLLALMGARALRRDGGVELRATWLRQLAHDFLIFVAVVSAVHLCAEIYYRFVYDTTDGINVSRVSKRWFDRHWKTNSMGYRDDVEYVPAIARGRRRITFVGDSATAAQGIEDVGDRFANRIRRARPDWEIEVIAQNGAATDFEIEMLEGLATRGHDLDVVVLVYAWNDIRPQMPMRESRRIAVSKSPPPGLGFLMDHSYGFNTLYYRIKRAMFDREDSNSGSDAANSPYADDTWQKQRAVVKRFFATARRRGATLVALVAFPRVQDLHGEDYAFGAMHERLAEFAREEDIPFLDLLPPLRKQSSERDLTVNRSDGHPNEFVHAEVARELVDFLEPLVAATPR